MRHMTVRKKNVALSSVIYFEIEVLLLHAS